ncbi:hypothetical protein [Actinoplanes sp. NBRC 103695]|uniref:hypothetical protein n=1 Tax=Actinoplanes sp. NBRC 103695 TaxID=3032202 RepID=UPI0024A271E7|nr:hypothetical protein [Actinoplanes sp. NBRC 103695]GLY96831.1 hypothetical protein Acsp02_40850 [Actinoplanes sp. NBRC 103695]
MSASDSVATSTIAVHRGIWTDPDLAAMVAPPVTVVSMPIGRKVDDWRRAQLQRSRGNMPVGRHRGQAR